MKKTKRFYKIMTMLYDHEERGIIPPISDYDTRVNMAEDIIKLRNMQLKLRRIAEDDCNGNPRPVVEYRDGKMYRYDEQDTERAARNDKIWGKLEDKVTEICNKWGWSYRFNADPRGAAVKLDLGGGDVDYIGRHTEHIC